MPTARAEPGHPTRASRAIGTLLALTLVVTLGWVDAVIDPRVTVVLLYLVPIALAAWSLGRGPGLAVAIASSAAWVAAALPLPPGLSAALFAWNAVSRVAIFVGAAWLVSALRTERSALMQANEQLAEALGREKLQARRDSISGLFNAAGFDDHAQRELARLRRAGGPVAVAYLDLDNFKTVNDTFGHASGDALLRGVGRAIATSIRSSDVAGRTGGDEFVVLLPDTRLEVAETIARRILRGLEPLFAEHGPPGLGVSIGVVGCPDCPESLDPLIERADRAMYDAKRGGKGRVVAIALPTPNPDAPPTTRGGSANRA